MFVKHFEDEERSVSPPCINASFSDTTTGSYKNVLMKINARGRCVGCVHPSSVPAASGSWTSPERSAASPALTPAFSRGPRMRQAAGARGSLHLQELCRVLAIMSFHQIHNFDLRAL